MKVLYLINSLGAGGAEQSLAEMLPLLLDRGVHVTVACLERANEGVSRQVINAGLDVRFLEAKNMVDRVRSARNLIKREQPDVVHTTIFEADLVGRFAASCTGVPVVTSIVNTSYDAVRFADPDIKPWKLWLSQQADGWTARRLTHQFHAITEAVKQAAIQSLGINADRIHVILRGRDAKRLGKLSTDRRRRVRASLQLPGNAKVILNVGRQEYQKGQSVLLDSFAQLATNRSDTVLLIAGRKGNATPELERRLASSPMLQNQVRFLGHREDVPDLLAGSDVFVFPSLYEGLGGAVIEAMALGLPVIASDIPAIREVTEDGRNATLVPASDPTTLAGALLEMLDDSGRRDRYGRRGQAIFAERFILDTVVDRMTELYCSVGRN